MQNINFETGIKSFTINNDESKVIRFNPSDIGLIHRIEESIKAVEKESKKYEDVQMDGATEKKLSNFIYKQIDYIFNSNVSDIVFEGTSPLTTIGGVPYYFKFIEAVKPIIEQEIIKEKQASEERIKKYTSKYKGSK